MTDEDRQNHFPALEPLRRYVPLAAVVALIAVVLFIPFKIISYGYLPADDALRHAAKAVCGKPWTDILVLGPQYFFDPNWGWHWLLRQIYLWQHCSTDTLVILPVAALFLIASFSIMACLRRPEAWLAAFVIVSLVSDMTSRFMLGRPFLLTIAATGVILLVWQRRQTPPPVLGTLAWMTPLIAMAVFLHGVWYLWALPIAAFFLAGQFRWCCLLAASWVMGSLLGAALTGHPVDYLSQAAQLALGAVGLHKTQLTLVTELRPSGGEIQTLYLLGGLVAMRRLAGLKAPPLARHPAFWLVVLGWVLGCLTFRFWEDWGAPALIILIASDLQLLFEARFVADSFRRLALVCCIAAAAYAVTTNDVGSRWTNHLSWRILSTGDPATKGWLPDKGGIFYCADQEFFYQTFFKNPDADWRYILGFESTLMPKDDFKTYVNIFWNFGDAKAYKPWVDKMRPEDRLVIHGGAADEPNIPQLEWNHGLADLWIGRLPRPVQPGDAPPTAPAVASPATSTK